MKSQALLPSIAMIFVQVFSINPRAKREVLKNAKCTWSSRDCIWSNFRLTNHLLNVSLETDNISIMIRRVTIEERARAVGMLQQGAGIRQVSHFSREGLQFSVSY